MPKITIHPIQRQFVTEGKETLLEGALRAGFALNYGCSNGNCGLCKAKLLEGDIERVRHHDYVLSAAKQQAHEFLLCAYTANNDVQIETHYATSAEDIPSQTIVTQVKKIEHLADDIAILNVQTPRTQRLRFLAGQSARLSLSGGSSCTLPIASCPCDDRNLQFHFHRHSDQPLVQEIFAGLARNTPVTVVAPQGHFVLQEAPEVEGLLFFACDTGFAPIRSLIEHALAGGWEKPITLFWFACGAGGHYMHSLMRAWGDAFDNFCYYPLTYDDSKPAEIATMLAEYAPSSWLYQHVYMSGQWRFVRALSAFFDNTDLPRTRRFHQVLQDGLCASPDIPANFEADDNEPSTRLLPY